MKERMTEERLDRKIVKTMAAFVREVAVDSLGRSCIFFVHQPKEPVDLAERLRVMMKK